MKKELLKQLASFEKVTGLNCFITDSIYNNSQNTKNKYFLLNHNTYIVQFQTKTQKEMISQIKECISNY
jgi:hypothetical protein